MRLSTRKTLDRTFTLSGLFAILLMALALVVILAPIVVRGLGAYIFRGTAEHRRMQAELFAHGDRAAVEAERAECLRLAEPMFAALRTYESVDLAALRGREKRNARNELEEVRDALRKLVGPLPGDPAPVLPRDRYGATRWDGARRALRDVLYREEWQYPTAPDGSALPGVRVMHERAPAFAGTALEPMFPYLEQNAEAILKPQLTVYWQFLTDESRDAHFFGGIWPELLGTFYLTVGAMLFAVPIGVLSAVYLVEYAGRSRGITFLRTCISTLAGVPSIVFGLFGLAFFINTLQVSRIANVLPGVPDLDGPPSKSVLAGALTLSLLILPTVIRASEEAIRAVPLSYKEAAMALGAGKWHTILTVVLPAALPGILTGIVISMGRAAGETAPIIFTAAVSVGRPLGLLQTVTEGTPALSWNIYNLATEHEAVDLIRHVQYGMVLTLVLLVLALNLGALLLRARISRKLKG